MNRKIIIICFGFIVGLFSAVKTSAQCTVSINVTDPIICHGDFAELEVITQGGGGWYQYDLDYLSTFSGVWFPFATQTTYDTATFIQITGSPTNSVQPAQFRITVTDTATGGCVVQSTLILFEPPPISFDTNTTNNLCFGDSLGVFSITNITGGVLPYFVSFNGGDTTQLNASDTDFVNLPNGTYTVHMIDANGCSNTFNPIITSPTQTTVNVSTFNPSCNGASTGAIDLTVSGGTPPYTYAWSTGATTEDLSNLSAGIYTYTVTDDLLCTTTGSIAINEPQQISLTTNTTSVSCFGGADGTATVSATGGVGSYSYQWLDPLLQTTSTAVNLFAQNNLIITVTDSNACNVSTSVNISESSAISPTVNTTQISCTGGSDGTATVSATGGVGGYSYLWFDGSTSSFIDSLSAGTYSVTVTDINSCDTTISFIITEVNSFNISTTSTGSSNFGGFDVDCNGDCDGGILITPNGGTAPFVYSLNGGPYQTLTTYFNLCADIPFVINAIDGNGCASTDTITLSAPPALTIDMDSVMENCNNGDGQATAIVGGGVSPYSYTWSTGQFGIGLSTITNLPALWYNVIAADANGCVIIDSIEVSETNMSLSVSSTLVSCNGGSDGTASVLVTGQYVSPLTYQWQPSGGISTTAIGLSAGAYTVTVTDGSLCQEQSIISVNEPSPVSLLLDSANSVFSLPCFEDSLGIASVSATGGTGSYWFYIDILNPQNDSTFNGLSAGSYLIFAEDINNCLTSIPVTISEPNEVTFSFNSSNVLCNGGVSGMAEATLVSGGTPPYNYLWSTGSTIDSIGGLVAGNYWLTITDSNNCTTFPPDTITINEPNTLQITTSSTSSNCGGTVTNGTAQVVAFGGTAPYNYLWNTGETTPNLSLLAAGTYTVIVTDDNNCVAYDTVIVQAGPEPVLTSSVQNISCFGANDGIITPSANAGTAPYQFSIDGGNTWQNNGVVYTALNQAFYYVRVRDANSCSTSDTVYVNEPPLLEIDSFTINEVSCFGGSDGGITVHHSGGTPGFSYLWNNGQTTQAMSGLSLGIYNVIVSDTNGCGPVTAQAIMTEPSILSISLSSTDVNCHGGNDGTATALVSGGVPPYNYSWSNGAITQTAMTPAGNITVSVTDFNGCVITDNITVNEPAALVVDSFTMDSVFCFGISDGMASVYISGGTFPYTFLWDNGDANNTADSLNVGYHSVLVTDFNNCTIEDSVEVLGVPSPVYIDSLISNQVSCKNASNGSIVVLATGGTPPYQYSKDGGNNYQTAIGFIGLSANIYNIVVKDNKGCTTSTLDTITEPDSLLIDSVIYHDISCNGYNNGYIQAINASGGTQPYMYSVNGWGPHPTLAYFNGYGPGTYTVEVIDDHNCVVAEIITINEPQALSTSITTSNYNGYEIKCNGDSTGWISAAINGGVSPYLRTWINAQGDTVQSAASILVDSLIAGLYNLVVLDANACVKSEFITLAQPDPLQHNIVTTHVTCDGWTNGSITDSVFGGVPGYTYLWNTGDTTYAINNLPIGSYTITATDENNCQSTAGTTVNDNNKLIATVNAIQDVSCYGYCDGYIEVTITGGMPFYNSTGNPIYNNIWNDPLSQITPTSIGLCADDISLSTTYTDSITDAIGCQVVVSGTITQPSAVEASATIVNTISCYAGNDGVIQATSTGGLSPHTYLWNNQQTGNTINNLVTGSYVVVATDANGCMDTTEIFLSEPTDLSLTLSSINVSCYGDDNGSITAIPSGGTPISPSGTYTYLWNDGQSTQTATSLAPGIYEVVVTDANGCTITSSNVMITQPTNELIVTADSIDETCVMDDGTAIANVFGGTTPYSYNWSNGQINQTITSLSPGSYTVDVTDANGCMFSASTTVNAFDAIFLPNFATQFTDTICLGDNITISVLDNPNFTYSWSSGHLTSTITVSPEAPRTDYILTVVDMNNCPLSSFDVTATVWATQLPSNPVATPNPIKSGDQVELNATSSNNYSFYLWADENAEFVSNSKSTYVYPEVTTSYYIMVQDVNGCQGYDSVRVVVGVYVFDGISPNGDGYNDFWEIEDIHRYPDAVIEVYNRWGSLLFSSTGDNYNSNKWDGTYNGEILPVGTYYYIINLNNDSEPQTGPITIVR